MVQTALWRWTLARAQAGMARANCLPTTFDSIGLEYAPRALRWIISARSLELPFQTIDKRRIDQTMAEHNVSSQGDRSIMPKSVSGKSANLNTVSCAGQ